MKIKTLLSRSIFHGIDPDTIDWVVKVLQLTRVHVGTHWRVSATSLTA